MKILRRENPSSAISIVNGKSRILHMEYELIGIGTVKMTVGVRRSTHEKVQYCITAIGNKE